MLVFITLFSYKYSFKEQKRKQQTELEKGLRERFKDTDVLEFCLLCFLKHK